MSTTKNPTEEHVERCVRAAKAVANSHILTPWDESAEFPGSTLVYARAIIDSDRPVYAAELLERMTSEEAVETAREAWAAEVGENNRLMASAIRAAFAVATSGDPPVEIDALAADVRMVLRSEEASARSCVEGPCENPSHTFLVGRAHYELGDSEKAGILIAQAVEQAERERDEARREFATSITNDWHAIADMRAGVLARTDELLRQEREQTKRARAILIPAIGWGRDDPAQPLSWLCEIVAEEVAWVERLERVAEAARRLADMDHKNSPSIESRAIALREALAALDAPETSAHDGSGAPRAHITPDALANALHDRIHPTSGDLIAASPIKREARSLPVAADTVAEWRASASNMARTLAWLIDARAHDDARMGDLAATINGYITTIENRLAAIESRDPVAAVVERLKNEIATLEAIPLKMAMTFGSIEALEAVLAALEAAK